MMLSDCLVMFRTEFWILEKVLKFATQFSRPGKVEVNSGKMVKSLEFFSFSKLQQVLNKCIFFRGQIPFNLACSQDILSQMRSFLNSYMSALYLHYWHLKCVLKKGWFLHFSRSLLTTYLVTLSLENKLLFWKNSGKSLEFCTSLNCVPGNW